MKTIDLRRKTKSTQQNLSAGLFSEKISKKALVPS